MVKVNNNTLRYRIGKLEEKVDDNCRKLEEILVNHLPHLNEQIIKFKTRIDILTTANIGAIILALLFAIVMEVIRK